jgi:glycosyltransferase involved in cell wall biosynthesis
LSVRACLFKRRAIPRLTALDDGYLTPLGMGLALGHTLLMSGALVRFVPDLVTGPVARETVPIEDEVRFVRARYGRFWSLWALARAKKLGFSGRERRAGLRSLRAFSGSAAPSWDPPPVAQDVPIDHVAVSVIIPTIDRYPYVRTLLDQLRPQTHPALEIFVIDQSPEERLDATIENDFADLPLRVLRHLPAGQSSSRNRALKETRGTHVLLLDDDIEVGPDLIEKHARLLVATGSDASCGVVDEIGAGPPPDDQLVVRPSDVFPAGNTLVRRDALSLSGLFDLAYERGARADHDLGMRLYLSGAIALLNPHARVLHHRAPQGGLRTHGARVTTYAASRNSLFKRAVPSASEIYLVLRYFSAARLRERLLISALGTLSRRGNAGAKIARAATATLLLPGTWRLIRRSRDEALALLEHYPQIDKLSEGTTATSLER